MVITLFSAALALLMLAVILYDVSRYIIPNNLNLVIVLLFGVAAFLLPGLGTVPALYAVAAAAIVLAVGMGIFALGLMGGGDIKLLAALTLWTGWSMASISFIVLTAIAGGLLVIAVLLLRALVAPLWRKLSPMRSVPKLLTRKQPVPYGIAIAGAFLWMLAMHQIPVLR